MPNPILKQAVGAGMAGLAAAKAVAPHFEKVVVLDRDALPAAPPPRPGTPQSRHTHGLLAGGQGALERLFPGIERDLVEAGAVRMRMRRDARFEVPGFDPLPQRDFGFDTFALSRPALERVCRRRVEGEPNIEFRPRTHVAELIASPGRRRSRSALIRPIRGRFSRRLATLRRTGSACCMCRCRRTATAWGSSSPWRGTMERFRWRQPR
jgi:2-polyprenyl-6-methoxyphenol hydroxylase-like FAD-dependent oxidoreductase